MRRHIALDRPVVQARAARRHGHACVVAFLGLTHGRVPGHRQGDATAARPAFA